MYIFKFHLGVELDRERGKIGLRYPKRCFEEACACPLLQGHLVGDASPSLSRSSMLSLFGLASNKRCSSQCN